jgi:glycine dehydrogenase subunit 1
MGPEGIYQVGYQAIQKATYMKNELKKSGFNLKNEESSLREFLVETKVPVSKVLTYMGSNGILAGIKYSDNELLVAVTEKRTKKEIDDYLKLFTEVNNG